MNGPIAVIELAVLALAAWPGIRLAADRRFRRLFPRVHLAVVAVLLLWAGGVAVVAVLAPIALHALAAAAVITFVVAAVRAHPRFGTRRGLPPGSLSVSRSVRALADRRFYLDQARRHGPIFKAAQFHRGVICVVGLERGHRLLREHASSITSSPLPLTRDISGGFVRYMDEATYHRYGPLLRKALARPVVAAAEPVMASAARRELDQMAVVCERTSGEAVRPGPYFERIVHDSFLMALFGIAAGTRASGRFEAFYPPIAAHELANPLTDDAKRALKSLRAVLLEHLGEQSPNGDEPLSSLTELRRIDPRLPDATCLDNLVFTLRISSSNVVSLLHWLVEMLGRHPGWAARARSELVAPRVAAKPDLVDRIVLETLRLAQSEYLYRVLADDVDYEGFRLPKGWLLRICVWESHRDPEAFDDPETFNPDRFLAPSFDPSSYSPFGRGQHACNGIPLAKSICRAVLEELISGFDWEVCGSGAAEHDFRHWNHWRPSSRLALRLTPAEVDGRARSPSDEGRSRVGAIPA